MKEFFTTWLFLFLSFYSFSQTPGVKWTKYLQKSLYSQGFYDAKATSDNGYIIVGSDTDFSFNKTQIVKKVWGNQSWIVKLDNNGNTIWNKNISGYHSGLTSVVQASDGGFVATGFDHDTSRFQILKYSSSGNLLWQKFYGGSFDDVGYNIIKTGNSGYLLSGYTESNDGNVTGNHSPGTADAWLVKTDSNGDIVWKKCFGGTGGDTAFAAVQTIDKGFVIVGSSNSNNGDLTGNNGLSDAWIFKIDSLGNLQWQKNYGGSGFDAFRGVVTNADGSFIVSGSTTSTSATSNGNKGKADVWVAKISSTGNLIWSKGFGGSEDEMGLSVVSTQDNSYLITGFTESNNADVTGNNGLADEWLIKVSDDGNLVWQRCIGTNKNEIGMAVIYNAENDYAIGGFGEPVSPGPFDASDGLFVRLGNTAHIKGNFLSPTPINSGLVRAVKAGAEYAVIPVNYTFNIDVEPGTYNLSYSFPNPYFTVTPSSATISVPNYFDTATIYFIVQPIPGQRDLTISAFALNPARPGFNHSYKLVYKNIGTDIVPSGTVLFKKDSRLNFVSASPPISSSSGDTLKWNYSNLNPFDSASITINFQVPAPPTVNINDTLNSLAIITPVAGDLTPSDDTVIIKQRVIGSYDPNDKDENFSRLITLPDIAKGSFINYIIRFQNTGTDTAFDVTVRDTLDSKLDWNSFEMIASSHSYQLSINNKSNLSWKFSDIKLVDSIHNEPRSHGFIAYRIKPLTTLTIGDTIHNSASIYFDFNLPVKTNITGTVVSNPTSTPPPTITSFTPTSGGAGTSITITGTNFTGATAVNFGGVAASSFTVNSATSITAVLGTGTSGNVSITTPGGTASIAGFTFIPPPTITSFGPSSAATGTSVTITGTNFTGATAVSFGGIAASSYTVNSSTSITAVVGTGASGNIAVTTPGGTATIADFLFFPAPTITSFTPSSGATGTSITITGTNFTGATAVNFGGVQASSFTVNSPTSITAVVGNGGPGSITVTTPGGTATMAGFTFIPAPSITSFTPTSGSAGTSITITGTNLTGATTINFGGVVASSFVVNSSTSITAVVGAGASGNVNVTTPGGTASIAGFTFIPLPTITSFTPSSGGMGTSITITGNNFTGTTAVNFGGVAASSFTVNSATIITAVVGTGASGNITITTPGGTVSIAGFTFNTVTG
ncbi:MAG TPA: IPT/TIG domain-containing protein, partial [Chitinophagaceae bacterium]|nr:IPT/TIG domain-containing protein [Chitinophagaceae bacterium]